ncbi:MAG: SUMF1/EgtB/PvdO family nonheme iron enzyme [Gemmatimonadetes bacterium]|nr:SUMF1/EgtB/PvdO family nonheme iron enzyme [Gemmatimonadota bacterium]
MTPPRCFTTLFIVCAPFAASARGAAQAPPGDTTSIRPYHERISGTLVSFEMLPVPGGQVQLAASGLSRSVEIGPFWMSKTEVTWDAYDVFVYALDRPDSTPGGADAVSRPTKPYVLPGEQFGHRGHPALAMTYHAAQAFAAWLSAKTGNRYRLPTEAEWEHACRLGQTGLTQAWHGDNAGERTHPVASLAASALGLHDLLGNVAGWVTGADGEPVAKGGSFGDDPRGVDCAARKKQTPAWNATDPQLPKSRWWLSDAPFVGFRLVREP